MNDSIQEQIFTWVFFVFIVLFSLSFFITSLSFSFMKFHEGKWRERKTGKSRLGEQSAPNPPI